MERAGNASRWVRVGRGLVAGALRRQKSAVGRAGELDEQLGPRRDGRGHGLTATAKAHQHRVPGGVAVVNGDIVLHLVALVPSLQRFSFFLPDSIFQALFRFKKF